MAIEGFDYKKFSEDMAKQAEGFVPDDLSDSAKNYLNETVKNFTLLAGEALYNDEEISVSCDQAEFIVQIIAEWTFHKCVDLAHSDIPKDYWNPVMQKIAFTIFEIAKQGIEKELDDNELLSVVEHHVKKVYDEACGEIKKDFIPENSTEKNNEQSNNNKNNCCKCSCKNCGNGFFSLLKEFFNMLTEHHVLGLFIFLVILISVFAGCVFYGIYLLNDNFMYFFQNHIMTNPLIRQHPVFILLSLFSFTGIIGLIALYIYAKKDVENSLKQLEKVREDMQNLVNPDRLYSRMGVDVLSLSVGSGLLQIADPDADGELLPKVAALRQRLTDAFGYIIPNIRIMDCCAIEANEYNIEVRGNIVASGYVYPEKYMVNAEEWDKCNDEIPEDCIIGVNPIYQTQAYWISKDDAFNNKTITSFEAADVLIAHFSEELIKHVDEILTESDAIKFINLVRSQSETLVSNLIPELISVIDLRKIFVNLIREKVSIKDICYIFERLNDYARFSKEPDVLSERLRIALARQICLNKAEDFNVLYCINLSKEWENLLGKSLKKSGFETEFLIEPEIIQTFIELIQTALIKSEKMFDCRPVILCSANIRLPLFRLLAKYIPNVFVMSYQELIPEMKVESVFTVGE